MLTRHLGQEDFDWHAQCQLRLSIPTRAGPHLQVLSAVYFEQPSCLVWYHEIPELMAVADLAPSAPFHLWDYFLEVLDDGYPLVPILDRFSSIFDYVYEDCQFFSMSAHSVTISNHIFTFNCSFSCN
jgi:hypothetical protein